MSTFSGHTEAKQLRHHEADVNSSLPEMVLRRLRRDVGPSFKEACRLMGEEGKPGVFIAKVGSIGLGSYMMADGMYHMVSANDEKVEDLFLNTPSDRNYTRLFAGGCEALAGALLAYLGATKGPIR